jgi:hypothetical protein
MWIPNGKEVATRPRRTIASPKRILTIFWPPLSFFLVGILPKVTHLDSHDLCSATLSAIVQNSPSETPEDRKRRMMVHFDSATTHTAKCMIDCLRTNLLMRAPHPALSPDLAPWGFYLFGKLKMVLMGAAFVDDNEFLQGVMEVLNGISREELAVFEEWLLRLDSCIQQNAHI